jgi:outer membrane protein insertion porin family
LGGRTLFTSSAELGFPLGLPEELGFSGAIFTDIGTLINPVEGGPGVLDVSTPRISSGVGLKWRSPFGPIRLDVALPVIKEDFDKEEIVRFKFGTRF